MEKNVKRLAFKMKLNPGFKEEYRKRHAGLWPEMRKMLKDSGVGNYSIFLDPETNALFGYIELEDEAKWAASERTSICRKWWDYMAPLMAVNPDNSPVSIPLDERFYME